MNKFFMALLLIFIALPFVSAINPHTSGTETSNGLLISSMFPDTIKQNNEYTFFWYVQNQSNSAFMNGTGISCAIELYKSTGFNGLHVVSANGIFDGVEEYSAYIGPGNFTTVGQYIERVKCNSTMNTGIGGIVDSIFEVTQSGENFNYINWLPIVLILFSVIFILSFLAVSLAKEHSFISIFFILLALFLVNPMLGIANLIVANDINYSPVIDQLNVFNTIAPWLIYGVLLYIVIYVFIKAIESWDQKKKFRLGLEGLG